MTRMDPTARQARIVITMPAMKSLWRLADVTLFRPAKKPTTPVVMTRIPTKMPRISKVKSMVGSQNRDKAAKR